MNYHAIYDSIIKRAGSRINEGYVEKHHITPRCMGGSDDITNLVELTAREHFVCHQLLVKMHPEHLGLAKAAQMMCVGRTNNRLYEWLRIKHALAMSESQTGSGNNNYGTRWVHKRDEVIKANTNTVRYYLDNGYKPGKKPKKPYENKQKTCKKCGALKGQCSHPEVCNKHQMVNTLIKHFGLDDATLGSEAFYAEYSRVVKMLYDEYHNQMMSTLQIADTYGVSSQRIDSIFKSLGIPKRTLSEALKVYVSK